MQQENAERFGRDKSPARRRAAADGAGGMDSPWIERELQTLRAMCESNRRDQDGEQVLTTFPFYNVRFGLLVNSGISGAVPAKRGKVLLQTSCSSTTAKFLPLVGFASSKQDHSTKQNVIVLE